MAAAFEIGGRESAGRMSEEYNLAQPFALHHGKRRVNVGKITAYVAYVKGLFALDEGAAVATQIHGIEIVAMLDEAVAHLLLEEIVIETVYVEDAARGRLLADPFLRGGDELADDSRDDRAGVVVGLADVAHLVAVAENVRDPPLLTLSGGSGGDEECQCDGYEAEYMFFHRCVVALRWFELPPAPGLIVVRTCGSAVVRDLLFMSLLSGSLVCSLEFGGDELVALAVDVDNLD